MNKSLFVLIACLFNFGCATIDGSINSLERTKGQMLSIENQIYGIEGIARSKVNRIRNL